MRRCMIGELKTMMPSTCVGMNEGGRDASAYHSHELISEPGTAPTVFIKLLIDDSGTAT